MNDVARNWAGDLELPGPRGKQSILKEVGDFANEHWAAWPSRKTLAKKTGLNPTTVSNYLRDLVKDGLLVPVPWRNEEGGDAGNGYYLTGCPEAPDFAPIEVAFKNRRSGYPRGYKPAWWSGEKGTGLNTHAPENEDPPWEPGHTDMRGAPHWCEGEGHTGVTPIEDKNKRTTSERSTPPAIAEAPVPGAQQQDQAAVAEVRAGAPTTNRDHQVVAEPRIPTQRQQRDRRSPIQQRDDDWAAQIAAADYGALQCAVDEYEEARGKLWKWAQDTAGIDMGVLPGIEWEGREEEQYRAAYLWLLKKHADDDWLDALLYPLDQRIKASVPAYEWDKYCATPPGMTTEEFVNQMRQVLEAMTEEEWGPQVAEIRHVRSEIWAQRREEAKVYLRGRKLPVEAVPMNRLAIWFTILHYRNKGKWPAAVVPPSLRSMSLIQGQAPSRAA
jgi:Helix-turn-helix domain